MVFLPNYFDIFKPLINVETALFLLDLILLIYFFLVLVSDILGEQAEAVESNNKISFYLQRAASIFTWFALSGI